MQLLIIRHGQSEADLLGVHEGRADFPLTEHGKQQAGQMAKYVAEHFPPEVILASPLMRANETAEILRDAVECPKVTESDLMEYNNGVLAGMSREEAAIKYPIPKNGRPMHIPIEEGESELEFRFRSEHILHKIIHDYHECRRVAIVSHGGMISNLIKSFLNLPNGKGYVFPTGDTGIHLLEIRDGLRIVRFLNRQEHLNAL
ncbi:histidine phosphatase family protein [Pseudoneobacillus sp. C159]